MAVGLRPDVASRRVTFTGADVVNHGRRGFPDEVRSLGISPDGRFLIVGARSGMVHLWDLEGLGEKPAESWTAHINQASKPDEDTDEVEAVVFSHDGGSFWSAGTDGEVEL